MARLRLTAIMIAATMGRLVAQVPASPVTSAATAITAEEIARHIRVIADDSMMGRDTPSPGLERTAEYIAAQWKQFGLGPGVLTGSPFSGAGGWKGGYIKHYPIPPQFDLEKSQIVFTAGGKTATASLATAAWLVPAVPQSAPPQAKVILIAGQYTGRSLSKALQGVDMLDKVVLYIPPAHSILDDDSFIMSRLLSQDKGLVVMSPLDSVSFAGRLRSAMQGSVGFWRSWGVHVRPEAVDRLSEVLAAGGINLARVRSDTTPIVRELPALEVSFDMRFDTRMDKDVGDSAPNVVAVLEGSDPKLKHDYVLVSAHMDQLGIRHGRPDSIQNGFDDNASGTSGLLALAHAFSQPGARPARSLVFLATSGGAKKGAWGSTQFAYSVGGAGNILKFRDSIFLVATVRPILNVNLDMIGRSARDSVRVDGLHDVEFATSPTWIATAQSDLGITLVDGGTIFRLNTDHFPIATLSETPSLAFYNGRHDDSTYTEDSWSDVDTAQEARILRLLFYVIRDIADRPEIPRWSAQGRQYLNEHR